jgi:aarF domain-containing kinase
MLSSVVSESAAENDNHEDSRDYERYPSDSQSIGYGMPPHEAEADRTSEPIPDGIVPHDSREALRPFVAQYEPHTWVGKIVFSIRKALRTVYLMALFGPLLLVYPLCVAPWTPESWHFAWYQRFTNAVQHAGSAFIKLGQWASHRADLFPVEMCRAFHVLRSQAPLHSLDYTERQLIEFFGQSMSDLFEFIDPEPVASGSIAQVYRARLHPEAGQSPGSGRLVALKVRHPDVGRQLFLDLDIVFTAAHYLCKVPWLGFLRLPVAVDEFINTLVRQVDFRHEAQHLIRFSSNFSDSHVPVRFPGVLEDFVSEGAMLMTWEDGVTIQRYVDEKHPKNKYLANLGYDTFMTMLLVHNFVHADTHAGNMIVQGSMEDNRDPDARPSMIVLDAGLVTELSPSGFSHLKSLFRDVWRADGRAAAREFIRLSHTGCLHPERFQQEMEDLFYTHCGPGKAPGARINVAMLIGTIMRLVRVHKLTLDSEFAAIIVSVSILEGLAQDLDPDIDVVGKLGPFLFGNAAATLRNMWRIKQK